MVVVVVVVMGASAIPISSKLTLGPKSSLEARKPALAARPGAAVRALPSLLETQLSKVKGLHRMQGSRFRV